MLAMMAEAETGRIYRVLKAHDIYSGLGTTAAERALQTESKSATKAVSILSDELPIIEEDEADAENEVKKGKSSQSVAEVVPSGKSIRTESVSAEKRTAEEEIALRAKERISNRKKEEEIAKEIGRAECIVETFSNVKVSRCILNIELIKL